MRTALCCGKPSTEIGFAAHSGAQPAAVWNFQASTLVRIGLSWYPEASTTAVYEPGPVSLQATPNWVQTGLPSLSTTLSSAFLPYGPSEVRTPSVYLSPLAAVTRTHRASSAEVRSKEVPGPPTVVEAGVRQFALGEMSCRASLYVSAPPQPFSSAVYGTSAASGQVLAELPSATAVQTAVPAASNTVTSALSWFLGLV